MIRFATEEIKAIRFEVDMRGSVEIYALNWLNICNNTRDNPDLLKCYNDSGTTVYVVCKKDAAEFVKDWLGWFGDVSDGEEVLCIQPVVHDPALTDKDFDRLMDAEILPVELDW